MINQEQKSAVSMMQYGIKTCVLTEHANLEMLKHDFESLPDSTWMNGKGKKRLHGFLKSKIFKEDAYFTKHPRKARVDNQRWIDFCNDCVTFAVLAMVLHGTAVHLIHPSRFQSMQNITPNGTRGDVPSLIPGIEMLNIQ